MNKNLHRTQQQKLYDFKDQSSFNQDDYGTNYQKKYLIRNQESVNTEDIQKILGKKNVDSLSEQEKVVAKDIYLEYDKRIENLESFLQKHYVLLQYKINKCMLNFCLKDVNIDYSQVSKCQQKCTASKNTAETFVENQINDLQQNLLICLQQSQKPQKDQMYELFNCYQTFFEDIDKAKKLINVEFSFYQ